MSPSHSTSPNRLRIFLSGAHEHDLGVAVRIHHADHSIIRLAKWVKRRTTAVSTDQKPLVEENDSVDTEETTQEPLYEAQCEPTFEEKYGKCKEIIGWGSSSVVKVSFKKNSKSGQQGYCYAIKTFKKFKRTKDEKLRNSNSPNDPKTRHEKRIASEFDIASSLHHSNIVHTIDLLPDNHGNMSQIMEFCPAGDLFSLIFAASKLDEVEADCFYKQLMRGIFYIHSQGLAHRDIKPENLLLTSRGCLKISDFGNATYASESGKGACTEGLKVSKPYAAPEVFTHKREGFDARKMDVWAGAVVYVAMRTGKMMWRCPKTEDDGFAKFVRGMLASEGFDAIEMIEGVSDPISDRLHVRDTDCAQAQRRKVLYGSMNLDPRKRYTSEEVLGSRWLGEIVVCKAGEQQMCTAP
jgi:protein-serine/threonine kinase